MTGSQRARSRSSSRSGPTRSRSRCSAIATPPGNSATLLAPCDNSSRMGPRACLVGCVLLAAASAAAAVNPPATPAIAAGPRTFVAFAGRPAPVRITWAPVAGAVRYRARWSDTLHPIDILLTAPVLERSEWRTGQHHVTVFAVDELGNESQPAELTLDVITIAATRAGSEAPEPSLSLIHISEPTRRTPISYAVFC